MEENSLVEDMSSIGLTLVINKIPTHFTTTSSTLLDLCFVNNTSRLLLFDQFSASMFSRHDLLIKAYDFKIHYNSERQILEYRDYKNIDSQCLSTELFSTNWDYVFCTSAVDDQLYFFKLQA